jgi:hypothetical protein
MVRCMFVCLVVCQGCMAREMEYYMHADIEFGRFIIIFINRWHSVSLTNQTNTWN